MAENKLKIWETALLAALCVTLCVCTWAQGRQQAISGELVRLHVIAASDDEYEQSLKLRVRDDVLSYLSPKLDGAADTEQAQSIIKSELPGIKAAAEKSAEGRDIQVSLSEEYYPTREYDTFSLPAGRYQSLRVIIGEGEGHNWWCVVFPPLCIDAAEQEKAIDAMDEADRGIITEADGYEIKFRLVELWGKLVEFFPFG